MTQWAWASHQPLVKANMEYFKPDFVLEIGTGLYSTPLLSKAPMYLGIEQDQKWIAKVNEVCPTAQIEHHNLNSVSSSKRHGQLSMQQKYDIVAYYHSLKERVAEIEGIKLLFVDCFACSRMYAINTLWEQFDIVMFHDCQPRSRSIYGYDKLRVVDRDLFYLQCRTAWTGMYVKKQSEFHYSDVDKYIAEFEKEWKVNTGMKVG